MPVVEPRMKVWSLVITAAYKNQPRLLSHCPRPSAPQGFIIVWGFFCARVLELEIEIALLMPGGRASLFLLLVVVSLEFLPLSGILVAPRALGVMG